MSAAPARPPATVKPIALQRFRGLPMRSVPARANRPLAAVAVALLSVLSAGVASSAAADPPKGYKLDGHDWTITDGTATLRGILLVPEGKGPFPAIVISHGLGGSAKGFSLPKAREWVRAGYVCIACDYTHSAENTKGAKAGGPADRKSFGASEENLRRAVLCLDVLASMPQVDAKRVSAYGNSMGAFLTVALAGQETGRLSSVAITAGGVAGQPGLPAPTPDKAAKINCPVLILHGDADTTVPPERSESLKRALDGAKVVNERKVFPGVGHDLHIKRSEEVGKLVLEWFTKHAPTGNAEAKPSAGR